MANLVRRNCWPLAIALLLSGCVAVESTWPLSDPMTAAPDAALLGHWVLVDEDGPGQRIEYHVFVGRRTHDANPEGIMELAMVEWNLDKQTVEPSHLVQFTATRVGEGSYVSLLSWDSDEAWLAAFARKAGYKDWAFDSKRKCIVVRYRQAEDRLELWNPSNEKVIDALVAEGKLRRVGDEVLAESLAAYLAEHGGGKLFDHLLCTLQRAP